MVFKAKSSPNHRYPTGALLEVFYIYQATIFSSERYIVRGTTRNGILEMNSVSENDIYFDKEKS